MYNGNNHYEDIENKKGDSMAVKPLDKYDYWVATIDWKAPHKWHRRDKFYGAGVDLDEEFQNVWHL